MNAAGRAVTAWRAAALALLTCSLASAAPSAVVEQVVWSEDGRRVNLTVQLTDLGAPAEVQFSVSGAPQSRAQARGTAVTGGAQRVTAELDVPAERRWKPLEITMSGLPDLEGQVTLTPPAGNLYVLAVGVATFGKGFANLSATVNDAQSLSATLERQQGRLYRKVTSYLLTEERATREQVERAMADIAARATPDDTVVALLSSHGEVFGGTYYTMLYRGAADDLERTALPQQVIQAFYTSVKGRTLLLIDTCTAGAALLQTKGAQDATQVLVQGINDSVSRASAPGSKAFINEYRAFITAAGPNQQSLESASLGHGYFTLAVLEALGNQFQPDSAIQANIDPNKPRSEIQTLQLLSYVVTRVRNLSADETDARRRQVPQFDPVSVPFPIVQFAVNVPVDLIAGGARASRPAQPDESSGVFMSPQGDDRASGARAQPVRTLTQALALGFSRVTLLPGLHDLPAEVILNRPVTLDGAASGATLRCTSRDVGGLNIQADVTLINVSLRGCPTALTVTAGRLTMRGGEVRGAIRAARVTRASADFQGVQFAENGAGRYTALALLDAAATLDGAVFRDNDYDAIRVEGTSTLTVQGSTFDHNARSATRGAHIWVNGTGRVTLTGSAFSGAHYSVASVNPGTPITRCAITDRTPGHTYQITGC
ncbi:caspase family protein [Deinococcus radiotolerans]|uniref:Peptidase C14 caspase domain-containing protein n=1 Tax=Deinococcus radiotolerans TaxID=1309407 RepID=A0ABQ2FNK3_9DEIO|nr:caspase family protein [Deinococcus radiotolerans]GGL11427.1 hypothetical protein GCM10010844_32650 [Deinococcus radiotolerans]